MKNVLLFLYLSLLTLLSACDRDQVEIRDIEARFENPDGLSGPRCWWWWLNSNVTREAITRDLEAMADKGFSGAMIFDAGTELGWGPDRNPPNGPMFSSPEWTELFLHALREAGRLGLELGLSIQSGWNLGGPGVTLDDKAKQITWSEIQVQGPTKVEQLLPLPRSNYDYYRDICLLAFPTKKTAPPPITHLAAKTGARELGGSAPDCRFLLDHLPVVPGEEDTRISDIQDISDQMNASGKLIWDVPDGEWTLMRIGYTPTRAMVKTSSDNWKGHVLDYLSKEAFNRYWDSVVDPLLQKAGPLVGTVLKQLETDSWECGGMNWSAGFAAEFEVYCGYDPIKYLPVVAGKIVENRAVSHAFLADLRKTIAHLVSENHYKTFAERAATYGLGIQPESAGPHAAPLDGITNYSHSDIVMSEFWIPSPHRPNPENRFFVKQAASAAHIYGKQFVGAESFTSLKKPHWADVLWKDLKPAMDYEFCEGLNMIFFHTFTLSPQEMGIPGQEYFAGTHVNPQVTWWDLSDPFMEYISRVQSVVQEGKFVADALYYYGDHVPNIAVYKGVNQAGVLPGYDYDVTNEEVLLELKVQSGKIVVPGGIQYKLLVLPNHRVLSLAVLEKVEDLLNQGATIIGPKPERLVSLIGGETARQRFHTLADELWGIDPTETGSKLIETGRLVWGVTAREYLQQEGVPCDFEVTDREDQWDYPYIHYVVDDAEVYFICNQTDQFQRINCAFRVAGRQPEIWDPVTGNIRSVRAFFQDGAQTLLPVQLEPFGSRLVVFRGSLSNSESGETVSNDPVLIPIREIVGPWLVQFDTAWGGPESISFEALTDWTLHPDEGIRYYSGKATYSTDFEFDPDPVKSYWIQLNRVQDVGMASIQLNGEELGITWTRPFRLEMTDALKKGGNHLEIKVVNSWMNRLVGDRELTEEERFTRTNINIRDDWELKPSGLLGPVEIIQQYIGKEEAQVIDPDNVKTWSAPYRNWHYHPELVIPPDPDIPGFEDIHMTDVPTVFQIPGDDRWYLSFVGYNGEGYQSFIAESDDLVHWDNMRLALGFGPAGGFDHGGVVLGAYLYEDYDIKAPRILKKKDGLFWSLYGAYPRQGGYELRPGSEGVTISQDGLTWERHLDDPILSVYQWDCAAWEKDCIYQPWLVEHNGIYFNFYNAANGKKEQLGLATSNDLVNWKRYSYNPVIRHGGPGEFNEVFSSDIKVFRDGDHWTGFFFGVGQGGAHIMVAFSSDLYHWTVDPEPLYRAGGNPSGIDGKYAHKISLVWNPDAESYYLYYCAVDQTGNRGIGLITSRPVQ